MPQSSAAVRAPVAAAAVPPVGNVGFVGFVGAMVLGIWLVDGWEVSASTSEETRGASRSAGYGGVVGLLVTAAFLFACAIAYLHVGGVGGISAHQVDVLAYVGERLGSVWRTVLIATVLVSLTAALETTLLYLVRSVYAMGRDGVLPQVLGRLGTATHDPDAALVAVTVASLLAMIVVGLVPTASAALTLVLNGTGVFLGLLFLTSCAAALRLRGGEETPLFAALGGLALLVILAVGITQAAVPTRWCIIVALAIGLPISLGYAVRKRAGKVRGPAAGNIGG